MSYQHMDHAEWMSNNNGALNRNHTKKRNWTPRPELLTEFQKKVCDILGMVGGGIYNAPIAHDSIDWDYGVHGVSVVWKSHELATFDFGQLTMLVFLCHEARIRCSVTSAGPRMLRLSFWQRSHEGSTPQRHPNLNEAVEQFRRYLPADHRILYDQAGVTSRATSPTTAAKETAMPEDDQTGTGQPVNEKPADEGNTGADPGDENAEKKNNEQPVGAEQ